MKNYIVPNIVINEIMFNNSDKYAINEDDIVIFVGANNVGKSRALKDIKDFMLEENKEKTIIKSINITEREFNEQNLISYLEEYYSSTKTTYGDYNIQTENGIVHSINQSNIRYYKDNPNIFYKTMYTFLSTDNRLNFTSLIDDTYKTKILKYFEKNESDLKLLNSFLYEAFEKGVDVRNIFFQGSNKDVFKIGTKDEIDATISSSRRTAYEKLDKLENLFEQGDGIRAAVAILSSLVANPHSLFLIDEPESFLHPPQARLLGDYIVKLSKGKQCFIATHNIDIIRGIIDSDSSRVKIFKINRIGSNNEFHLLKNESVKEISLNKHLKYTNILNGLFYDKVVLCENEADCKFFSAILENINLKSYQSSLFCGVGGKDQFKNIIPMLIDLNIDYAVISDIDLIFDKDKMRLLLENINGADYETIKENHQTFLKEYYNDIEPDIKTVEEVIKEILDELKDIEYLTSENKKKIRNITKEATSTDKLKKYGINLIKEKYYYKFYEEVDNYLKKFNIYLLDYGEIESLNPSIKSKHSDNWVRKMFEDYPDLNNHIYDKAKKYLNKIF